MSEITPQEARQFAEEAYIFAFSMLENYKTMYVQAVNENLPTFGHRSMSMPTCASF